MRRPRVGYAGSPAGTPGHNNNCAVDVYIAVDFVVYNQMVAAVACHFIVVISYFVC